MYVQRGAGTVACVPHAAHSRCCIGRLNWQLTSSKSLLNGRICICTDRVWCLYTLSGWFIVNCDCCHLSCCHRLRCGWWLLVSSGASPLQWSSLRPGVHLTHHDWYRLGKLAKVVANSTPRAPVVWSIMYKVDIGSCSMPH